jgi:hypothetical protein
MIVNYDHKTFIVQATNVTCKYLQPSLIFVSQTGAYRVERLKGAPLQ